ncbi:MAG: hypothetical protein ACAH88_20190, partial [Roseimicrobium sp.]
MSWPGQSQAQAIPTTVSRAWSVSQAAEIPAAISRTVAVSQSAEIPATVPRAVAVSRVSGIPTTVPRAVAVSQSVAIPAAVSRAWSVSQAAEIPAAVPREVVVSQVAEIPTAISRTVAVSRAEEIPAAIPRSWSVSQAAEPTAFPRAMAIPKALPSPLSQAIQGKNLYSFQAENLDLKDALALFARANNLNIVTDLDVTGQVNVDLHDLPLDTMMEAFLEAHGFYWEEKNGLIRVHTMETRIFPIDYPRLVRSGS